MGFVLVLVIQFLALPGTYRVLIIFIFEEDTVFSTTYYVLQYHTVAEGFLCFDTQ